MKIFASAERDQTRVQPLQPPRDKILVDKWLAPCSGYMAAGEATRRRRNHVASHELDPNCEYDVGESSRECECMPSKYLPVV
jgi:hypothetical protein